MRIAVFCIVTMAAAIIGAAADEGSYPAFLHALHESMAHMQDAMHRPGTGNPDRDFALMMIPHHQGAIEMAKVELLYGTDPVLRRLAQEIVADQQSEINAMQLWLTKEPGAAKGEK